jgi:hypothetical protein
MSHQIWYAKHKTKTEVPSGSYSRVDRETALSGVKQYHWFTRDDEGDVHRVACRADAEGDYVFALLCDASEHVDNKRVSQSEVGRGPVLTCSACAASDAP